MSTAPIFLSPDYARRTYQAAEWLHILIVHEVHDMSPIAIAERNHVAMLCVQAGVAFEWLIWGVGFEMFANYKTISNLYGDFSGS